MSVTSKNPLRFAGAVFNSGNVNTGEQNMTFGGLIAATVYSGIASGVSLTAAPGAVVFGSDILFYSGAGRLKDVMVHQTMNSGKSLNFYDASNPTSGGPAANQRSLGSIQNSLLSGNVSNPAGTVIAFDIPFQSGLCVNLTNNPTGFTVTYTPEANPPLANPG